MITRMRLWNLQAEDTLPIFKQIFRVSSWCMLNKVNCEARSYRRFLVMASTKGGLPALFQEHEHDLTMAIHRFECPPYRIWTQGTEIRLRSVRSSPTIDTFCHGHRHYALCTALRNCVWVQSPGRPIVLQRKRGYDSAGMDAMDVSCKIRSSPLRPAL
jgi:hypothetical protein